MKRQNFETKECALIYALSQMNETNAAARRAAENYMKADAAAKQAAARAAALFDVYEMFSKKAERAAEIYESARTAAELEKAAERANKASRRRESTRAAVYAAGHAKTNAERAAEFAADEYRNAAAAVQDAAANARRAAKHAGTSFVSFEIMKECENAAAAVLCRRRFDGKLETPNGHAVIMARRADEYERAAAELETKAAELKAAKAAAV